MNSIPKDLLFEVHVRNEVKRVIYTEAVHIREQLIDLIGKKVFKADGSRAAVLKYNKLDVQPRAFAPGTAMVSTLMFERYGKRLSLKANILFSDSMYEGQNRYEPISCWLGTLDSSEQILEEVIMVEDLAHLLEKLDASEELRKIKAYKALRDQMEEIEMGVDRKFYTASTEFDD